MTNSDLVHSYVDALIESYDGDVAKAYASALGNLETHFIMLMTESQEAREYFNKYMNKKN